MANKRIYDLTEVTGGTDAWASWSLPIDVDGNAEALYITALELSGNVHNVLAYGATGGGVADDTTAIQSALDAAAADNGIVYLPQGTYLVSIQSTYALQIHPNITVAGAGAGSTTIKLDDTQGNYYSILFPEDIPTDVSNFTLRDLTIDQNSTNNTVAAAGDLSGNPRFVLGIYVGDNVRVQNCRFTDIRATNTIVVNGNGAVHITGCTFDAVGGGSTDFDHSTLYLHSDDVVIANNVFNAASVLADGATTAIETHGSRTTVVGNQVYGYEIGMNITGVADEDCVGIAVTGNAITDCMNGILMWGYQYNEHTTGYGLDGVTITGNSIKFVAPASRPDEGAVNGIVIENNGDLDNRNITIANNVLWSELESEAKDANSASIGIGWWSTESQSISNITIANNVITNFPLAAIRFGVGTLTNCTIANNVITNPGSTLDTGLTTYQKGIMVYATTIKRCKISNNIVTDDNDTTRMTYGISVDATSSSANVEILWNTVDVTGGTQTAYVAPFICSDTDTKPLLIGAYEGFSAPATVFVANSQIWDRTNGVTWHCVADATTWVVQKWGTAAPGSGTWRRGDIVWNYTPSASGNIGWVCTSAGTPGTWKAFGTIAA